jgi:hypothetical protein
MGLSLLLIICIAPLVLAQSFAPPPSRPPKAATLQAIDEKIAKLRKEVESLRRQGIGDPWLAELEVYSKAAVWIRKQNEFYQAEAADWTLEALDRGLLRARQAAQGEFPWVSARGHPVIRAYRSRVDGSVQPYAVTLPAGYGEDKSRKWRLDVVLHGRDPSLTEVKFLHHFNGDQDAPRGQNYVRIDIFGRGNNAYRWAGETDVLEAVDNFVGVERMFNRDQFLDPARRVLRGFSMGGAGTWHLGLHRPDRWCVLGPGAGFTATKGYIKGLGELTPVQEACLRIYDAVDYAENVFNVPVVAYAGADDPQLQAARNIEGRLMEANVARDRMELLVAPQLGHQFPPDWQKKADKAYRRYLEKGRAEYPARVRFVTYTLKYATCDWVEILGLDRHYRRTLVDARATDNGFTVKTTNVRAMRLSLSPGAPENVVVDINGQSLTARPRHERNAPFDSIYLQRRRAGWESVLPQKLATERARKMQKLAGLQGPIDDAFTDGFLLVRGTGENPWHAATQEYAQANLERFKREWARYMRGELRDVADVDVTDQDIATKHLILFGDPASNSLIAAVLDDLPLRWTRDTITLAGKKYDAATHVPVLIYPSPLNPQRYVVLNSGHTFHAADFLGTNALLFPRLGDYAVLKLTPTEKDPLGTTVAVSGLYDDYWQIDQK